jgi:hypothetical protein
MRHVLNITVYFETQDQMASLLEEVSKDIWDCNKGSVELGSNTGNYARYFIGPAPEYQTKKSKKRRAVEEKK